MPDCGATDPMSECHCALAVSIVNESNERLSNRHGLWILFSHFRLLFLSSSGRKLRFHAVTVIQLTFNSQHVALCPRLSPLFRIHYVTLKERFPPGVSYRNQNLFILLKFWPHWLIVSALNLPPSCHTVELLLISGAKMQKYCPPKGASISQGSVATGLAGSTNS